MHLDAWLKAACEDAERRGLPELKPMLETLARSTAALRVLDHTVHPRTEPRGRATDGHHE